LESAPCFIQHPHPNYSEMSVIRCVGHHWKKGKGCSVEKAVFVGSV